MKRGHKKSRLDECKKFDEECKFRYIAGKIMRLSKGQSVTIHKTQGMGFTCNHEKIFNDLISGKRKEKMIGPAPANINPFFELQPHERKILKKRIKRFKNESPKVSKGIEKFRKAALGK